MKETSWLALVSLLMTWSLAPVPVWSDQQVDVFVLEVQGMV
ncbi:MAG: hypothetical protein AB1898_02615 [Acidobacteriota bacterium]